MNVIGTFVKVLRLNLSLSVLGVGSPSATVYWTTSMQHVSDAKH